MSVVFNKDTERIVQIENSPGSEDARKIQFQRSMSSRTLRAEAAQLLKIFNKYDKNGDGFLSVDELKKLIATNPDECKDIPRSVATYLNKYDANNDGKLNFDEFYKLARENQWIMREWCIKYCEYIIPPNKQQKEVDEVPITAKDIMDVSQGWIDVDDLKNDDVLTFCPPKLTMITFSIIEIVFFVMDAIQNQKGEGPMATLFIYNPYRRYEVWRFMTYMFVHIGVMHLMMNLVVQILFGIPLEHKQGWWRVSLIYLSGVLAGSLGTSIRTPTIFLAGASAGVYALITSHVASIIMNWSELKSGIYQIFFFVIYIGTDAANSYIQHITVKDNNVGYMAHLCGGLAGLLVGIGILKNIVLKPHEKVIWWMAVTVFSGLMIVGICYQFLYPEYFLIPQRDGN